MINYLFTLNNKAIKKIPNWLIMTSATTNEILYIEVHWIFAWNYLVSSIKMYLDLFTSNTKGTN
jgi:hypothetical protein